MRTLAVAITLALACAAHAASPKALSAFTSVQVCTPFNVAVAPSTDAAYTLTVDAADDVMAAVQSSVTNNILSLSSKGSFSTDQPIKVTVGLPADKLAGVQVSSAAGINVVVLPGFSANTLTGKMQGGSVLDFTSLTANSVRLINTGTGDIIFNGTASSAAVQASGTGTTYVAGVSNQISVSGSGTSTILINSPSNSVKITGRVNGISNLQYNRGTCTASGAGLAKSCVRTTVNPPQGQPQWTCGLQQSGSFGCQNGSGSSSSSSSGNGNSFSGTSFTSSGDGNSFSSSSSSNPGNSFSSSSQSGQGSSTLTTNTGKIVSQNCAADDSTLVITS